MSADSPFPCGRVTPYTDRRSFLQRAGLGFGMFALADLLAESGTYGAEPSAPNPLAPRVPHFAAKAKSVIWLFMEGGPSGFDLFDPKPELQKRDGEKITVQTFFGNPGPLLKSPFAFKQYGQSGAWVSELLPHLAEQVDRLAFVKSCHTESNNHAPAMYQMNTGLTCAGFPSAGSWVTYGLGSENQELPGYVVLGNSMGSKGGPHNWSAGFLPSNYQGTQFRAQGSPLLNLSRPAEVSREDQRAEIDLLAQLDQMHAAARPGDSELLARIQNFELAFRMQTAATELIDLDSETAETRQLYGLGQPQCNDFARKCLLARRLVERGVRFVQVYCDDEWDAHGDIVGNHQKMCRQTDQPVAALLADLARRGLLDSTLVIWGGEFGRMPVSEQGKGRDHNPHGFLTWMAGAGIRAGSSHGATDEFGLKAVVDPVSVNDLHATMLHLLGIDHQRLTYLHNGRRFRLTDVAGNVLTPILA